MVHFQLFEFLQANDILYSRQAGFRPGHSTTTALACLTDDIGRAIDRRMVTILILFDFSKAFDSIPHDKLLEKLRKINVSDNALKWLYSYLSDRI